MNVQNPLPTRPSNPVVVPFATSRLAPREREFGVGYGKSSGYATTRRYAAPATPRLFRFA